MPNLWWNCREPNGIPQTRVWKERRKRSARRRLEESLSTCATHVNGNSTVNSMRDKSEKESYSLTLIYAYLMSEFLVFP